MASKIPTFVLSQRIPIWVSLNYRFSSIPFVAHVQTPLELDRNPPNSTDFESTIRFLKNKLNPDKLIHVLDSTSDLISAINIFKWASLQKNFRPTADSYAHMVLRLGLVGMHQEMEVFLKEMVKLECPSAEEAFGFLIDSFCRNHRLREALKVFEIASLGNRGMLVSTCNVLLGALVAERRSFESVVFVYKEMVKVGIIPDVETLNYLIEVLCETERLDSAMNQFHRMEKKGCVPNARTFEILISGLCTRDRVDESIKVLNQMLEVGCNPHRNFYDSTIPLLCKFNRFEEGAKLFRMMKGRGLLPDLYLYSVLTHCLCKNLQVDEAIELFEEVIELGMAPLTSMYVDIVSGYCELGKLGVAMSFLDKKDTKGIEPYNALLKGYCDLGRFPEASSFLSKITEKGVSNSFSWNILIRGLCGKGYVGKAFEVLGRMVVSSYIPEEATYSAIIIGYCKMGAYKDALDRFNQVCARNMYLDSESSSELIEGLCHVKKIQEASEVFYYTSGKGCTFSTSLLNILIQGICLAGKVDEAIRLRSIALHYGTSSSSFTYATLMLELSNLEKAKPILPLLSQMLVEGCTLDAKTYCILIRGLCAESTARYAALVFKQMVHDSFIPDPETLEILLFCMSKCSQLHIVMHSLDKVMNGGLLSPTMYNTVIYSLLREGHKHEASKFLDSMLEKGWVPDADTHGLLVGNVNLEERDCTIEVFEDAGDDKVSSILADGLENPDEHMVGREV